MFITSVVDNKQTRAGHENGAVYSDTSDFYQRNVVLIFETMKITLKNILTIISLSYLFIPSVKSQVDENVLPREEVEVQTIEICTVCNCEETTEQSDGSLEVTFRIVCSKGVVSAPLPELDKIKWPENAQGHKLVVEMTDLGLTTVQRIPPNILIDIISFKNNAITTTWPKAFETLPNLRILIFSENELNEISPDIFENLESLEELDLSFNKLIDFNRLEFAELANLKKLNLRNNLLTRVPLTALSKIPALESLDLSNNQIFHLEFNDDTAATHILRTLKSIDLSGNKLSMILESTFANAELLEYLDLSNSELGNIEQDAFSHCTNLKELNLAQNRLTRMVAMPASLQRALLQQNSLSTWPNFPKGIKYIDLSINVITDIYDDKYVTFDELQVLNISGNQITNFNTQNKLPSLAYLDISHNLIQQLSSSFSKRVLPALEELRVDGNPLQSLQFEEVISLKRFFANRMRNIAALDKPLNIQGRDIEEEGTGYADGIVNADCIEVSISHCDGLERVEMEAFNGVPLCFIDLSYNNLTKLQKNAISLTKLNKGIDLQGNPWNCECHLQWILDDIVPELYATRPDFLDELRCDSPIYLQDLRLVHWYNWDSTPLCDGVQLSARMEEYVLESQDNSSILTGANALALVLICSIMAAVVVILALIVYLARSGGRKRRMNQKPKVRKRQEVQDIRHVKGMSKDQGTALTKV